MAKNTPWDWNDESFILDADSPLAISQSLWDEWTQSEADAHALFASTPSSEVTEPAVAASSMDNGGKSDQPGSTIRNADIIALEENDSPRCKRRRMLLFPGDQTEAGTCGSKSSQPPLEETMANNCEDNLLDVYEHMQVPDSASASLWFSSANEESLCETPESWMLRCINERESVSLTDHEQQSLLIPVCALPENDHAVADTQPSSISMPPPPLVPLNKPRLATPVAYPFEVVKPSGVEGDVTLNDINQRILMPPTRPIQHPVGDNAKPPSAASTGSGLSGKAVVALTKIHTEGKGTITIMRTKG